MTLVEPKPSPRPWFAVWRRESGSFAQLPLLARALFTEILKLTNDEGVIDIGTREPAEAIAWALGADRSDRRAIAKYIPMLLADGCLVHANGQLLAAAFKHQQSEALRAAAREYIPKWLREYVFERDGGVCTYCGDALTLKSMHIDHVVPVSRGGGNEAANLAASCRPCNLSKGAKTPEEWAP